MTAPATRTIPAIACWLALAAPVLAQQDVFDKVPLRVAAVRPGGTVTVDRGARDLVQAGDKVVLLPRNGAVVHGTVTDVSARSAEVELVNRNDRVAPGVKGEVLVPRARRRRPEPVSPPEPETGPEPAPEARPPGKPAEPRTPAAADDWRPGMPLLAGSRPLRPAERARRTTGRVYLAADGTHTLSTFDNSFLRLGTDFEVENPAGHGGTLRLHTEFSYLTETTEQTDPDLRIYDLSYSIGGTRYDPTHWQLGRFLPRDMPEFGLLDGVGWGHRTESGHRFGASLGFLPELDEDLESGSDLALSFWYLWPDTLAERLTWGIGYQKSWHNLRADRDLVVGKVRYLPVEGWDAAATTWIDVYHGSDTKGDGPELTRVRAHAARRFDNGAGLAFAYDHEEYPDQRRTELTQTIAPATLLDAHHDRLSLHAYVDDDAGTRWFTRLSGFTDESRTGGTAEVGVEVDGLLQSGARTGLAGFTVHGRTSTLVGGRVDHGGELLGGRLDLLGEVAFVHHEGFPDSGDDLLQYRLAGYWSADLGRQWSITGYGDGTLWDRELSFALGFYLQRIF